VGLIEQDIILDAAALLPQLSFADALDFAHIAPTWRGTGLSCPGDGDQTSFQSLCQRGQRRA
jgi:hypothetical protein